MSAPFYSDDLAELHVGHVLDQLRAMPAETVQAVVTSPPYWGLRDYGLEPQVWGGDPSCTHEWASLGVDRTRATPGILGSTLSPSGARAQAAKGRFEIPLGHACANCGAWRGSLGLEPTVDLYVDHLVAVFREIRRVLRPDGTLWLNLGDSYTSGGRDTRDPGKSKIHPAFEDWQKGARPATPAGLKPKDLVGIPWRVAFALQADGWWLRADIIWSKPNPMPSSVLDRPTLSHEYLFLLTRSERYYYDAVAVQEPARWPEGPNSPQSIKSPYGQGFTREAQRQPSGWNSGATEGDLLGRYKNAGQDKNASGRRMVENVKAARAAGGGTHDNPFNGTGMRNRRSVWEVSTQPYPDAHFATYPTKLVEPCILAGTSARGSCPSCGAPWARVVERLPTGWDGSEYGERAVAATGGAIGGGTEASTLGSSNGTMTAELETVGWRPNCGCGTGLAADAWEVVGSPTSEQDGEEDPTLEVGRAGMSRPRRDDEGTRPITRHEQRQYAAQLKASPHREAMEAQAGPAFAHYLRTDATGARPIPDRLLTSWVVMGWLSVAESPLERLHLAPEPVPCAVLDPFAGSGTTLAVAKALGRRSVGVELSPAYAELVRKRVGRTTHEPTLLPDLL